MMTPETVLLRTEVPWRNIDGNVIIVKPAEGNIYPLNSVATQIWLMADGTRCVSDILEKLYEEFEAEKDEIQKDVLLFLEEMERATLIQKVK